jgi:lipid II:glycine glycyltransferase (peptidoglycan interpeptide bridge formation enzyme)
MLVNTEEVSLGEFRFLETMVAMLSRRIINGEGNKAMIHQFAQLGYEMTITTESLTEEQMWNICQKTLGADNSTT